MKVCCYVLAQKSENPFVVKSRTARDTSGKTDCSCPAGKHYLLTRSYLYFVPAIKNVYLQVTFITKKKETKVLIIAIAGDLIIKIVLFALRSNHMQCALLCSPSYITC